MEMGAARIFMWIFAITSSMAVYVFFQRLLMPEKKEEGGSIADLVQNKAKATSSFDKLDPEGSLLDKLDLFLAKKMKVEQKLEYLYMLMGNPSTTDPLKMLHQKELIAVILPALAIFFTGSFLFIVLLPVGFMIPDVLAMGKIQRRQEDILANFPTSVDLAALIIESGLDYMTAFERIVKISTHRSALEEELDKTLREVQLGYSRREALQRFAARTGLQEIRSFVGLIVQSDELGTSLVDLLRNFAADMRFRRLTRAERMAAQASTKMLIPLFIFIFPTVFIMMLAPMLYDLVKGGSMPF